MCQWVNLLRKNVLHKWVKKGQAIFFDSYTLKTQALCFFGMSENM